MIRLLSLLLLLSTLSSAQSFRDVSRIPPDSMNAETMRIWIPVTMRQAMVTVTLFDGNEKLVRNLLKASMIKGYYNIYWDKKDDSGNFVEPGDYFYALNIAGQIERKPISVAYQPGENCVNIRTANADSMRVDFSIDCAETPVSFELYDIRDRLKDIPIKDSVFTKGRHSWQWQPSDSVYYGKFTLQIKSGEFVNYLPLVYKRK